MTAPPLRGQLFRVDIGYGPEPWLVVSNNARNRKLDTILAARITTTSRNAAAPTLVPLNHADGLIGYVVVDDIVQLYRDELAESLGALSSATMLGVSAALRVALP